MPNNKKNINENVDINDLDDDALDELVDEVLGDDNAENIEITQPEEGNIDWPGLDAKKLAELQKLGNKIISDKLLGDEYKELTEALNSVNAFKAEDAASEMGATTPEFRKGILKLDAALGDYLRGDNLSKKDEAFSSMLSIINPEKSSEISKAIKAVEKKETTVSLEPNKVIYPDERNSEGKRDVTKSENLTLSDLVPFAFSTVGVILVDDGKIKEYSELGDKSRKLTVKIGESDDKGKKVGEDFEGYDAEKEQIKYGDNNIISVIIPDENIVKAREYLNDCKSIVTEKINASVDDVQKKYYEDIRFAIDPDNGNVSKAFSENPYLLNLKNNTNSYLKGDYEESKNMLKGTHESQKNLPPEEKPDIYEDYMRVTSAFGDELKAEYIKQDIQRTGYTKEKEQLYLNNLKESHTGIIEAYERLAKIKDHGQYNKYTGNQIESYLGLRNVSGITERAISSHIGYMIGENKAIENGWSYDELAPLAALESLSYNNKRIIKRLEYMENTGYKEFNGAEAQKKNKKEAIEDKEKYIQLQNELEKIKNAYWDKKNPTAQDKKNLTTELMDFIDKNKDIKTKDNPFTFINKKVIQNNLCAVERKYNAELGGPGINSENLGVLKTALENMKDKSDEYLFHSDSKQFKNMTSALENVVKYGEEGNVPKDQLADYRKAKNEAVDAIQKYFEYNKLKSAGSDMGNRRKDTAFLALNILAPEKAKQTVEKANEKRGKKEKIDLKALIEKEGVGKKKAADKKKAIKEGAEKRKKERENAKSESVEGKKKK